MESPRFCGACGAAARPGAAFCVMCGRPLGPAGEASWTAPPPAPWSPAGLPPPPLTRPPSRTSTRKWIAIAVVAVLLIGILVAVLVLGSQPRARFLSIEKQGLVGDTMTFLVTMETTGGTIPVDGFHLNIESWRASSLFDSVYFYNIDAIPGGTRFTWDVDVYVDPYDAGSFTYKFSLEVNGARTDSRTVV